MYRSSSKRWKLIIKNAFRDTDLSLNKVRRLAQRFCSLPSNYTPSKQPIFRLYEVSLSHSRMLLMMGIWTDTNQLVPHQCGIFADFSCCTYFLKESGPYPQQLLSVIRVCFLLALWILWISHFQWGMVLRLLTCAWIVCSYVMIWMSNVMPRVSGDEPMTQTGSTFFIIFVRNLVSMDDGDEIII